MSALPGPHDGAVAPWDVRPRPAASARRTGTNPIERRALHTVQRDIAAMSASEVVQLALWPTTLVEWAEGEDLAPAQAYNMLRRFKPYRRAREALARRLGVDLAAVDHLVDRAPRAARTLQPPAPPVDLLLERMAAAARGSDRAFYALELGARDGTNPIERRAVFRVETDIASFPASLVVQLALWPETITAWAESVQAVTRASSARVFRWLAKGDGGPRLLTALAERLGVREADVVHLLAATRPTPRALTPTEPPPDLHPSVSEAPGPESEPQIALGF